MKIRKASTPASDVSWLSYTQFQDTGAYAQGLEILEPLDSCLGVLTFNVDGR